MTIEPLRYTADSIAREIADKLKSGYTKSTVVREVFQNADDARATRLAVGFHPGIPGHADSIRRRPGLLFVNDGPVKDEDIAFLKQIKANRRSSEAYTIGRFGVGKLAFFNWADAYYLDFDTSEAAHNSLIAVHETVWQGEGESGLSEPIAAFRKSLQRETGWEASNPSLAIWLPIRQAADQRTILKFNPEDLPTQEWICDEKTWIPYLRMLPMLSGLKHLSIHAWGKDQKLHLRLRFDLEGEQRDRELLEKGKAHRSFKGSISSSSGQKWVYFAEECRLPETYLHSYRDKSITLADLKRKRDWPDCPEDHTKPEPKIPHTAVMVIRPSGGPGKELPDINPAAFLPLGSRDLGHCGSQVLLHANGFLNEQRTHFTGLDGSEDQPVPSSWNLAMLRGGTLPLLPGVLERAMQGMGEQTAQWVSKLQADPFIKDHPDAVGTRNALLRTLELNGPGVVSWAWKAVGRDARVLRLSVEKAQSLGNLLRPLVEGGLIIVDAQAPALGEWRGSLSLSTRDLSHLKALAEACRPQTARPEQTATLIDLLCELKLQLPPAAAEQLSLPVRSGVRSTLTLAEARAVQGEGRLWIADDLPLFDLFRQALGAGSDHYMLDARLASAFGLGARTQAYGIARFLSASVPALSVSFDDRFALLEALAGVPTVDILQPGLRYLLHASPVHLDDDQELLVDQQVVGQRLNAGVIQDLMDQLAAQSPSWTHLPTRAAELSVPFRRWLGVRVKNVEDTLQWALEHPTCIAPPTLGDAADWSAQALAIIAGHLNLPSLPENRRAWARLPLHDLGGGQLGAINTEQTYRRVSGSPAWTPPGVLMFAAYALEHPSYRAFADSWEPWSAPKAVEWVLDQDQPHRFAIQLLDNLGRTNGETGLNQEVREKLRRNPWIPVTAGPEFPAATSLDCLVQLPPDLGEGWGVVLSAASGHVDHTGYRGYAEGVVAATARNHKEWQDHVVPLLNQVPRSRAFKLLKLARHCPEVFQLGCSGMITNQQELEILVHGERLDLQVGVCPRPALGLLTGLVQEGLLIADLLELINGLSTQPLPAAGYKALLLKVGSHAHRNEDGHGDRLGMALFKAYLQVLGRAPVPSDFVGLFLPTDNGIWKSAQQFPDPDLLDQDHDRNNLLAEDWHTVLRQLAFEWPVTLDAQDRKVALDLKGYFAPWVQEGVPRPFVACFLSVMGGNHRDTAISFLDNSRLGDETGLRHIRNQLSMNGDLQASIASGITEGDAARKDLAFDRHNVSAVVATKGSHRSYTAMDGQQVQLSHIEDALVQKVIPGVSIATLRRNRQAIRSREIQVLLAPPLSKEECARFGAKALNRRIEEATRDLLMKAYCNDEGQGRVWDATNQECWKQLWGDFLSHQDQMHLRGVQKSIKQNIEVTISQLAKDMEKRLPGPAKLSQLLGSYKDKVDFFAETEYLASSGANQVRDAKKAVEEAHDRLVDSLGESDIQEALLSGVRHHIRKRQYSEDRILYELYQNAEDAYADWEVLKTDPATLGNGATFSVAEAEGSESLNIRHWGRPICFYQANGIKELRFKNDLENMLRFNVSSKADTQVGEHGLGFKSIYLITDRPIVFSASLAFTIDAGIFPNLVDTEHLAAPLRSHASMAASTRGTLIHLPLSEHAADSAKGLVDEFWNLGLPLLAFSRQIRTLRRVLPSGKTQDLTWNPQSLWTNGECDVQWMGTKSREGYLRFGDSLHALLMAFNSQGKLELPAEAKTLWAMAPTKQEWGPGLKVMLQAPFGLDQGRTRLGDADSANNLEHFRILGGIAKQSLEGFLASPVTEGQLPFGRETFLQQLWEGFAGPLGRMATGTGGDQMPYQLAVMEGLKPLWADVACCPDGMGGFQSANGVHSVLRSANSRVAPFWEELQRLVGELGLREGCITEGQWNSGLQHYRTVSGHPGVVDEPGLLKAILSDRPTPEACARIYALLELLPSESWHGLVQALRTDLDVQALTDSGDGYGAVGRLALPDDENQLLWALAPGNERIHTAYGASATALLKQLRKHDLPTELIGRWLIGAWDDLALRASVKRYLEAATTGNLARQWLLRNSFTPVTLRRYLTPPSEEQEEQEEQGEETPKLSGPDSLRKIYAWWDTLDTSEQDEYGEGYGSGLQYDDFNKGTETSQRVAWMKLLVFGAGHTVGYYSNEQLRRFIHKQIKPEVWSDLVENPPAVGEPGANDHWMNLLNRQVQEKTEFQEDYDHLLRTLFGAMHRIGFALDPYIELFRMQDKRKADFDILHLAVPATDPALSRSGLGKIPSLRRIMGHGLNIVLRELRRTKVLVNRHLDPHVFAPVAPVRKLLNGLHWAGSAPVELDRRDAGASRDIYAAVFSALQEEGMALPERTFDLPLLAFAEDKTLREDILGSDITKDQ